jgi:hypothetical protein
MGFEQINRFIIVRGYFEQIRVVIGLASCERDLAELDRPDEFGFVMRVRGIDSAKLFGVITRQHTGRLFRVDRDRLDEPEAACMSLSVADHVFRQKLGRFLVIVLVLFRPDRVKPITQPDRGQVVADKNGYRFSTAAADLGCDRTAKCRRSETNADRLLHSHRMCGRTGFCAYFAPIRRVMIAF